MTARLCCCPSAPEAQWCIRLIRVSADVDGVDGVDGLPADRTLGEWHPLSHARTAAEEQMGQKLPKEETQTNPSRRVRFSVMQGSVTERWTCSDPALLIASPV